MKLAPVLLAAAVSLATTATGAGGDESACDDGTPGGRVVAISARHVRALYGAGAEDLRLWAVKGEVPTAIPFQIDQCSADGRVILGGPADPLLGDSTVLLFAMEDAGDRSTANGAAYEIEIVRPEDPSPRWAYLGRANGAMARSLRDDVDYDPARDRVHAQRYALGFERPQIGYFSVADGKGHERGNWIDRLKARVRADLVWGLFSFHRTEDDVGEEVIGYRDGPVRVVRRGRIHVEIGWGLPSPDILADDYFYADHAEGPIYISLPFSLAYVFGDLDVRIYLDFRNLSGYEVASEGVARGAVRIGGPTGNLGAGAGPPTTWFMLIGPDLSLLHRLRFGPTLLGLDSRLFYVDDPEREDPPETVQGLRPGIGYRLTGWSSVGRGRHEIWMDTYILQGKAASDPECALRSISAPVHVRIRPLTKAGT